MNKYDFIQDFLSRQEANNRLRSLKAFSKISAAELELNGKKYINFSSNDYLGLSKSFEISQKSILAIDKYGTGNTASHCPVR